MTYLPVSGRVGEAGLVLGAGRQDVNTFQVGEDGRHKLGGRHLDPAFLRVGDDAQVTVALGHGQQLDDRLG